MSSHSRLHALDAVRAFALLLGVVFHAGFSFIPGLLPGLWAMADTSPSSTLSLLLFTSHMFRMSLFFFIAGFFARMLFHRGGARGFWGDRSKRILVPMIVGWLLLAPATIAVWIWGLTKTFKGTLPAAPAGAPPAAAGAFPLTHLWFLYYLLILYVVVLFLRGAVVTIDRSGSLRRAADTFVGGLVRSGAAALVLALPVTAALYLRHDWVIWFGIPTPDQSLIPQWTSLLSFGTATAFGWLVHRNADLLGTWAGQWKGHLALALITTAVCVSIGGVSPAFVPAVPGRRTLAFAACYSLAIWCWNFAILGLALRFLSRANATVRYVADASYWIYLVHLPVVAAMQVVVGHLPWHWTVKFPLILLVSLSVLLLSYRYLVRATFIGHVLSGRKKPRGVEATGTDVPSDGQRSAPPENDEIPLRQPALSVAGLRGVHKRYGQTVALDGLSLDVSRGELLALLGPNGAGKSTAISLWLGLMEADAGEVRLFGRSPSEVEARRAVGIMMQDVSLTPELRVRELIALTASYYPNPLTTTETLELTGTGSLANRRYGTLSGGQKRQVQFALAVCGRPSLLFLDEPTVGLDVQARESMWRTLRELVSSGCSVVLTTHYLEEAEALADRVAVLAHGRLIASGGVEAIRALVLRSHITCSSRLSPDDVGSWPYVAAVTREEQRLRISTTNAEEVVRRLLAADESLAFLEVRRAGLAEAFSELTKEAA